MKVLTVADETKIFSNNDGTISASGLKDMNGEPKKFREIAPLMFREVNGQSRIAFKRDSSENLVAVIDYPFMVFQKAPWYQNSALQLPPIIVCLVVILLTVVLWPVMALARKHYGKPLDLNPQQRRLRLLVRLTCLVYVLSFAAFVGFLAVALKDIGLLSPRGNPWLRLIQIVGWIGIVGTVVALYNGLRSWRDRGRWLWSRIGDTLIALACWEFCNFVI